MFSAEQTTNLRALRKRLKADASTLRDAADALNVSGEPEGRTLEQLEAIGMLLHERLQQVGDLHAALSPPTAVTPA